MHLYRIQLGHNWCRVTLVHPIVHGRVSKQAGWQPVICCRLALRPALPLTFLCLRGQTFLKFCDAGKALACAAAALSREHHGMGSCS